MLPQNNNNFRKFLSLSIFILLTGIFAFLVLVENDPVSNSHESRPDAKRNESYPDSMKVSTGTVMINPMKQQLIGVKKYTVQKMKLVKRIRTVGLVEYDERRLNEVNLKVEGWVKHLYANYKGKYVRKGESLFKLYSPELLNAQEEYLLTTSGARNAKLKASAKIRLSLWDISESQIRQLDKTRKPSIYMDILSPVSGYIISKSIIEGGHITPGETLLRIGDISRIWVLADIYEYELPFIKIGQTVNITTKSLPGQTLSGDVTYIYPDLSPQTRSVKIRIDIENKDEKLKPGMFANVQIEVAGEERLAIPESAVLNSGNRNIVFLSRGNGIFVPREIELGPVISGFYPLLKGLAEGDVVVSSGNFFLDSESQLTATMEGRMGLLGMGDWKMEHSDMGEMDMSGMEGMKMDERSGSKTMESMQMNKDSGTEGAAQ